MKPRTQFLRIVRDIDYTDNTDNTININITGNTVAILGFLCAGATYLSIVSEYLGISEYTQVSLALLE